MHRKRTDLALESRELHTLPGQDDGLETVCESVHGIPVTKLYVHPGKGEERSGKPSGIYITVETGAIWNASQELFETAAEVLAGQLRKLLPKQPGCVLVVGLGNEHITSDSIGPRVASQILVTRHLRTLNRTLFCNAGFGEVASLAPGVLGQTGMESAEIVESVVKRLHPTCVIAVDALASRRLSRLATTVQLSTGGIRPGSGVCNRRAELSEQTLGVPVLSVGVPTVVDAGTLACDLLEELAEREKRSMDSPAFEQVIEKLLSGAGKEFFVTLRDSDSIVSCASKLIATGINLALHEGMTVSELSAYRPIG